MTTGYQKVSKPRKFFSIEMQDDGTADVYLTPNMEFYENGMGLTEFDVDVYVLKGVLPFEGLEEDIRARFDDWIASAQPVDI